MPHGYITTKKSTGLSGSVNITGAKNATLPILASLILTDGVSTLDNVPHSTDILKMIFLLEQLGAQTHFDSVKKKLTIDTSTIKRYDVCATIMNTMRASILVMGPLLARFGKARVALPGGCLIGERPINYHLKGLAHLGIAHQTEGKVLEAFFSSSHTATNYRRIILEYPSVGATENIMMLAAAQQGTTVIINAALEPEVLDLINAMKKMGAHISTAPGAIIIQGVTSFKSITHTIIPDRLEAGALLIAASMTGGTIQLNNARPDHMDIVIAKLQEMGHSISFGNPSNPHDNPAGITLKATPKPQAINIKTGPYPNFPTDLQPPLMAALTLANGTSIVEETVFENRLMQVQELQKMGAQISTLGTKATIRGVEELYGTEVLAHDIRGACALVLAGFKAEGITKIKGLHHWHRAYDKLEIKLKNLGATINTQPEDIVTPLTESSSPITQRPLL